MANRRLHRELGRGLRRKLLLGIIYPLTWFMFGALCGCHRDHKAPLAALGTSIFTPPTLQNFPGGTLKVRIQGQSNAVRMSPNGVIGLQNALGHNLIVVNCAFGGSRISEHLPGTSYFQSCESAMPDPDIIVWYQGESDAKNDFDWDTWAQKFTDILNAWRSLHGNIPIVFAQINHETLSLTQPNEFSFPHWQNVKDQQASVFGSNLKMIKTDDLELEDGIHITQKDQFKLGARFAEAIKQIQAGD